MFKWRSAEIAESAKPTAIANSLVYKTGLQNEKFCASMLGKAVEQNLINLVYLANLSNKILLWWFVSQFRTAVST